MGDICILILIPGCFGFKIELWMFGLCPLQNESCVKVELKPLPLPIDSWWRSLQQAREPAGLELFVASWSPTRGDPPASLSGAPPHPAWRSVVYTASRTWPTIQYRNDTIKDELEISNVNLFFTLHKKIATNLSCVSQLTSSSGWDWKGTPLRKE